MPQQYIHAFQVIKDLWVTLTGDGIANVLVLALKAIPAVFLWVYRQSEVWNDAIVYQPIVSVLDCDDLHARVAHFLDLFKLTGNTRP